MIPVKQTLLHDPDNGQHGNCLSAVLASLLHLPVDSVPVFTDPNTWVKDLNAWLRQFGLAYIPVTNLAELVRNYGITGLWHEIAGDSPRSKEYLHACVAKDLELLFDPHPDNTGLHGLESYGIFIALEPWKSKSASQ